MVAVYLIPAYVLVNLYFFRRIYGWLKACSPRFQSRKALALSLLVYVFLAVSMLIAFFLPAGGLQRIMKLVGNYWLGILLYMGLTLACADILRFLLFRSKRLKKKLHGIKPHRIVGGICAGVIAGFCLYGVVNARIVRVTPYEVTIDKKVEGMDSLKLVLVADLHLGYNIGLSHMQAMVEKINAQDPDLVVIAGDIFDNEWEAVDQPDKLIQTLQGIQSRYGVYACYGNHDIEESILAGFTFKSKGKKVSDPHMDEFLEQAGIQLLRDDSVMIADSIYLYGRPDAQRLGRGIDKRKTPAEITEDMDLTKPILVMDHQPRQLQELAEAGVDLDLCGHTHDGQLFPANLTTKLMWENSCGYMKIGQMHNIVTSGLGLFGPNMRVGTRSEICPIVIHFAES